MPLNVRQSIKCMLWYIEIKKGVLKVMKKRTLRLINYIFIIAILLGTMYLDKVQAYSCDLFNENIFSDTSYSYSCESTPDASFNSNIRYNHECRVFATPEPSIDDSRPCTTQMLG